MNIELPDGRVVEIPDGVDMAKVEAALAGEFAPKPKDAGGPLKQGGMGLASGLNSFVSEAVSGPNIQADMTPGPDGAIRPRTASITPRGTRFDETVASFPEPVTTPERYARRIGEEVGYGAPMGGAGAIGLPMRAATGVMGANAAMDATAGAAGQGSGDLARSAGSGEGGAATVDAIVAMLTGGASAKALGSATKTRPPAPTMEDNFRTGADRLEAARNSGVALTPQALDQYKMSLSNALDEYRATDPRLNPRANATVDSVEGAMSRDFGEMMDDRRYFGNKVAANPDEADVGVGLKKRTEEFIESLQPQDVTGGDPAMALEDMREGNRLTAQAHKAKEVTGQEVRAEGRAATSGRGGNSVNTMRQNVRKIWENEVVPTKPGKRHGYTPDEVAQMEKIVFGEGGQNMLRHVAGLSPTTGALPAWSGGMMAGSGALAAAMTGNPLPLLGAVPPAAGYLAKGLVEKSTKKQIAELLDTINRGGTAVPKSTPDAVKRAIVAQLASRAAQAGRQ